MVRHRRRLLRRQAAGRAGVHGRHGRRVRGPPVIVVVLVHQDVLRLLLMVVHAAMRVIQVVHGGSRRRAAAAGGRRCRPRAYKRRRASKARRACPAPLEMRCWLCYTCAAKSVQRRARGGPLQRQVRATAQRDCPASYKQQRRQAEKQAVHRPPPWFSPAAPLPLIIRMQDVSVLNVE